MVYESILGLVRALGTLPAMYFVASPVQSRHLMSEAGR
jgi:hypothetical protein